MEQCHACPNNAKYIVTAHTSENETHFLCCKEHAQELSVNKLGPDTIYTTIMRTTEKVYAIWVENIHSNFGECPYNPERYNTVDEAEKAFGAIFDQENVRLMQDAGLYFSIKEI